MTVRAATRLACTAILLLGPLLAHAAPRHEAALVVLPPGTTTARASVLASVVGGDATVVSAEEFEATAALVRVEGLPRDDCDGRVPIDDWRARLEKARGQLQLLAFTDALAGLVALDVELVCLTTPPATSDLFRLELSVAEAHLWLAQSAGKDEGKRAFHQGEAKGALVRAASFGASLSPPADLSPEVLAAFEDVRRRSAPDDDLPRVVVTGPGARVGARFNGRPLASGAFDALDGSNLVQAADGARVTAAARLRFPEERTIVWLAPEGDPPLRWTVGSALDALQRGPLDADATALLAAAAQITSGAVSYVEDGRTWVRLHVVRGDALEEGDPIPVAPPAVDAWGLALGVGPAGGWTNLGSGPLDGLGGPNAGVSVYARVAVNRWLAVAANVHPWAVASAIDADAGGGTLFRATIPARVGVRFGPHGRRFAPEAGVDVGAQFFGAFDDRQRASFLAAAAAGVSGAVGPTLGLRLEGWFGAGLGYVGGGAQVGVEGRL